MNDLFNKPNEELVTILDEFLLKTFSVLLAAEADFEHILPPATIGWKLAGSIFLLSSQERI